MATRPNRLERITNLLLVLLDTPRPLSLREIGATVAGYPADPGALRQAFERDKRTLRDEGIPIATERIDGEDQVGYQILPEQYYLADLTLESDEQEAIAFALAAVKLDSGVARNAGAKLGSVQTPDIAPVVVLPTLPYLGMLQEAVRTKSLASFRYRGKSREVAGYGLAFKGGSWYFIGGIDSAGNENGGHHAELRTFRVDRLESEPTAGEPGAYEVPPTFELASELRFAPFAAASSDEEVTIDVDVRESRRAMSLVGPASRIDGAPAGSMRFRFSIGDTEAFVSWVLGLGDAIEVIAPKALRESVIERLQLAVGASS